MIGRIGVADQLGIFEVRRLIDARNLGIGLASTPLSYPLKVAALTAPILALMICKLCATAFLVPCPIFRRPISTSHTPLSVFGIRASSITLLTT